MNKRCPKCDTTKPLNAAYWNKHRGTRDGWQIWCKACQNEARRAKHRGSAYVQQVAAYCHARARSVVEEFRKGLKKK